MWYQPASKHIIGYGALCPKCVQYRTAGIMQGTSPTQCHPPHALQCSRAAANSDIQHQPTYVIAGMATSPSMEAPGIYCTRAGLPWARGIQAMKQGQLQLPPSKSHPGGSLLLGSNTLHYCVERTCRSVLNTHKQHKLNTHRCKHMHVQGSTVRLTFT